MNFELLKNIIQQNQSFLLTTHVNPDADAIGSEVALYKLLKKLGKDVIIINHSVTPYNLKFLDIDNKIESYNSASHDDKIKNINVLFALDFNRVDRIVSMQQVFTDAPGIKICIDHHQDKNDFADHYFVDTNYSATGEILYDFIIQSGIVKMDKTLAYPIYAAIMTDTGSFRFERTTPELHRKIANLLETGVNPSEVYDKLYDESKPGKLKLLGKALESLEIRGSGKIGFMTITQQILNEVNAIESDTENFVNYTLSIENVVLGILFIELKNGFKVSFRSKGKIPVNKLAGEFGGGGHTNAAGARFHNSSMEKLIPIILKKAEEYLTEL